MAAMNHEPDQTASALLASMTDAEVVAWARENRELLYCIGLVEALPNKWMTVREAREMFCGGPVLSQTRAEHLAAVLQQTADELAPSTGLK